MLESIKQRAGMEISMALTTTADFFFLFLKDCFSIMSMRSTKIVVGVKGIIFSMFIKVTDVFTLWLLQRQKEIKTNRNHPNTS